MKNGFSLVELSIVLVILGLLVGGILAGQSLIRASQLRSVTVERDRYFAATQSFRDKYFALPGDMINATSFWGIAGGTGSDATCQVTASTSAATCNGNGDGAVTFYAGAIEYYRFWQQLAAAGLIEGQYTGIATGAMTNGASPGVNVPLSKLGNSAIWFVYTDVSPLSGNANQFDGTQGGRFTLLTPATSPANYGVVTPSEAWNIDTKMDDGKPGTGMVKSTWGSSQSQSGTACTNAANSADITTAYNLGNGNKDCTLIFNKQF